MWCDKKARKQRSSEESCQEDSRQERYTDSWINGTTKNIGVDWKEIGDDGKARHPRKEGR